MRKRGFEIIEKYSEQNLHLPTRATKHAAGYDFEAAEDVEIPSIWSTGIKAGWSTIKALATANESDKSVKPTLVATGIKSYMQEDEYLQLANRSSNPLKRFLLLANGVGVIDADYYNNPDNEGHIMFQFINFGFSPVMIQKGERIGQGIFHTFLKADNDEVETERESGFGSTGN
ncbi:dUTP pyrophosphatase [Pilibacter termitis]|uniref:dUTP diphosphatase n=1 Tax=Pilibacter termitis TaxID=263852 RepID=A0A1T4K1R2_9ENTE|nr:dUTP diphosphatase [Pilibacter termitis]SJZ36390.1 dUTP pyrophosphatase [Pilibacter termitis]